mmetsp:Transcript_70085/g.227375  ORF Transcript_70085/g.227375 Transcript_70085/m.227375 type:complete len:659 (+) Transcript_70085:341-2317(+)
MRLLTRAQVKPFLYRGPQYRACVAVYFGTFDPIHDNHFRIALCALRKCGVRRVIFVPNPSGNPYKPSCSSVPQRVHFIEERIRQAEFSQEIEPGQMSVLLVEGATNWPQREAIAQSLELEEFAETQTSAEVAFLLGEDSFSKSLQQAKTHKNNGIFQLKSRPRQIFVFPRSGTAESILASIPERLKPWVRVAPYQDLVQGLSSSSIRQAMEVRGSAPAPDALHPALWTMLRQSSEQPRATAATLGSPSLLASVSPLSEEATSTGCVSVSEDPRMHYDSVARQSLQQRCESMTVRLRNYNSFAKSVLLERCFSELRTRTGCEGQPLAVLDLGCGKGGDLKKFANCGVTQFCGVDISAVALEELLKRVHSVASHARRAKHGLLGEGGLPLREVCIVHADCWRDDLIRLLDEQRMHSTARLQDLGQVWFHAVSSQMACHYAFEAPASAEALLRNAASRLCDGGIFVGTVPDATRIVAAQQAALQEGHSLGLGQELFRVEFEPEEWEKVARDPQAWRSFDTPAAGSDVFGVMYKFTLRDAVERCNEPLVHFETFRRMAQRHGLVLHWGPTPLADIAAEAHGDADMGRLRRIYFHSGGLNYDESSRESDVLRFYIAFAFRKVAPDGGAMSGRQLSEHLSALHRADGGAVRLPASTSEILRAQG